MQRKFLRLATSCSGVFIEGCYAFLFYKGRVQESLEVHGRGRNWASDSEDRGLLLDLCSWLGQYD